MKRILFVDDEQQILDGLRDLLRKQRHEWEMVFALGGEAALAQLALGPFDVVVSDMRMPGISGAELLEKVRDLQPKAARIILSGQAERGSVVNALPVAHQFLSKPCDADVLRSVVERACGLQALLHDDNVRDVIGRVDKLPPTPRVYFELTQAARNPNASLAELAAIVEQDASMSIKVLQLVNSSYFRLAQKQTSIERAVAYLGSELLRALALTAHVFSAAQVPLAEGFSLDALQEHSMLSARIAKGFFSDKNLGNDCFTAALVHDVGEIVLAMSLPVRYAEVLRLSLERQRPLHELERELLGVTHAEVGAYLLGLWGLPLGIVEAVAYHHAPGLLTGPPAPALVAVHVASALSRAGTPASEGLLDLAFVESSPFAAQLPSWRALANAEMLQAEADR